MPSKQEPSRSNSGKCGGSGQGLGRRLNTMLDRVWTDPLPIYVWVIEHPEGIIVVDTGETARASQAGYFPWWHPYYRLGVREWVRPEEEVGPQLRALGIPPEEVRWVIMTHLHSDHAGGLAYFPKAEILLSRTEYQQAAGGLGQVIGYLPQHWPTWFDPSLISFTPASVGSFPQSYPVTRAQDVLLVPTAGHTAGHLSVVVLEDDQALVLAGDTSYTQQLMLEEAVDGVAPDEQISRQTLQRIHAYTQQVPTVYLPSHDPEARERLFQRQTVLFPETSKAALKCDATVMLVIGVGREIGWMKGLEASRHARRTRPGSVLQPAHQQSGSVGDAAGG